MYGSPGELLIQPVVEKTALFFILSYREVLSQSNSIRESNSTGAARMNLPDSLWINQKFPDRTKHTPPETMVHASIRYTYLVEVDPHRNAPGERRSKELFEVLGNSGGQTAALDGIQFIGEVLSPKLQ